MTPRILVFYAMLSLASFSCQRPAPPPPVQPVVTIPASPPNRDSLRADTIRLARIRRAKADSVWLSNLETAAYTKIRKFRQQPSARFRCDSFHFEKGPLINPAATHLLLYLRNRDGFFGEYQVYELKADSFIHLLGVNTDISTQGFVFKDVNGDGQKDFILEGYGTAGTGEKYFNDVYLYNPREHRFDQIEGLGLNPHFYPQKGIVTCYYNPSGGWNAEKYRLNWNKLELLEEIEVDVSGLSEGKCIRKINRYRNGEKFLFKEDRICGFPLEYKRYKELVKVR